MDVIFGLENVPQLRGQALDDLVASLPALKEQGDDAYERALTQVCASTVGLAVKTAVRYSNGREDIFHDIVMAAMNGIVYATKSYDKRKARFSTHCMWWARAFANRELNNWDVVGGYAAMRRNPYWRKKFSDLLERFPLAVVSLDGCNKDQDDPSASIRAEWIVGEDNVAQSVEELNTTSTVRVLFEAAELTPQEIASVQDLMNGETCDATANRIGVSKQVVSHRRNMALRKLRNAAVKLGITRFDV